MPVDTMFLKRCLDASRANRSNIEATFEQVEKWVGPLSGGQDPRMSNSESSVDFERSEVWDFTAPDGADKLAANLYTMITNPALRWLRLAWLDKKLQQDTVATAWLDDATDIMFAALQDSDFYTEIGSFYQDLTRYCTAAFVAEAKVDALSAAEWKGLDFTAPPIRECFYQPDSSGGVFRFWRILNWTITQITSKWPAEEIPAWLNEKARQPDASTERFQVAYCFFYREERLLERKQKAVIPELRPVGSVYFLAESGEQLGKEGGFYEMPAFIVPWDKAAGSDWGHGPGIRVLPTVRYLNARLETTRAAGEKAVDPSVLVTERGLMGDLDLRPGGMTQVRTLEDLKALESKSNFVVGEHDISDLRAMIRGAFWTDELTLKLSPAMTATEVNARIDQMNRLFGPTLARIQSNGWDPMVQVVFAMLYRAGMFPAIPKIVQTAVEAAGGKFSIQYQGPLSRAQRMDEVASIERLASFIAAHVKMGFPKAALSYNEDAAVREIAKRLGTPAVCLFSVDEVKLKVRQMDQLQAQAAAAEVARAQGEAIQQNATAMQTVQSTPANPTPIVTPEAAGGLM